MIDQSTDKDVLIAELVAAVLAQIDDSKKPSLSWFELVSATNGKITNPQIVASSNKLLEQIIVSEFGSINAYKKALRDQQKVYESHIRKLQKQAKRVQRFETERPLPTKPVQEIEDELPDVIEPVSEVARQISKRPKPPRPSRDIVQQLMEKEHISRRAAMWRLGIIDQF